MSCVTGAFRVAGVDSFVNWDADCGKAANV